MPTYFVSELIEAPPEAIWPVLTDVRRWPDWTPTVRSVEPIEGPELAVGSRFRVYQPKLRPALWTVTEVRAPHGFTWESRSAGMHLIADHLLSAREPGRSTLELRFTFRGLLGAVVGRITSGMVQEYLQQEAAALKSRVEGGPVK